MSIAVKYGKIWCETDQGEQAGRADGRLAIERFRRDIWRQRPILPKSEIDRKEGLDESSFLGEIGKTKIRMHKRMKANERLDKITHIR